MAPLSRIPAQIETSRGRPVVAVSREVGGVRALSPRQLCLAVRGRIAPVPDFPGTLVDRHTEWPDELWERVNHTHQMCFAVGGLGSFIFVSLTETTMTLSVGNRVVAMALLALCLLGCVMALPFMAGFMRLPHTTFLRRRALLIALWRTYGPRGIKQIPLRLADDAELWSYGLGRRVGRGRVGLARLFGRRLPEEELEIVVALLPTFEGSLEDLRMVAHNACRS